MCEAVARPMCTRLAHASPLQDRANLVWFDFVHAVFVLVLFLLTDPRHARFSSLSPPVCVCLQSRADCGRRVGSKRNEVIEKLWNLFGISLERALAPR